MAWSLLLAVPSCSQVVGLSWMTDRSFAVASLSVACKVNKIKTNTATWKSEKNQRIRELRRRAIYWQVLFIAWTERAWEWWMVTAVTMTMMDWQVWTRLNRRRELDVCENTYTMCKIKRCHSVAYMLLMMMMMMITMMSTVTLSNLNRFSQFLHHFNCE